MKVSVQFFGHYSDLFPQPLAVEVDQGATLHDLTASLTAHDAHLSGLAAHCRFAVGDEYAPLTHILKEDDTVAVLPPMSGG